MDIEDSNLDNILTEVGEFGPFQIVTYLLFCIPTIIPATYMVNYMISANTLDYRCKVPECDIGENNRDIRFDQPWLHNAIPYSNDQMDNCFRYATKNQSTSDNGQCNAEMFDKSIKIECSEFVYASNERNLQTEFDLHCSDSYKLAYTGELNLIGRLIFLPLTGLLCDRFGRLTVVIVGIFISSLFGLIKTFSFNYPMYLTFELLESSAGASSFEGSYLLSIEWVNSNYRVLGSTIIHLAYAVGEMLFGLVAMLVPDFRTYSRILYAPGLLVIAYIWLVPESVRWLLVTGRVDRAIKILKRTAKINRKELSEKSIELITLKYSNDDPKNNSNTKEGHSVIQTFCLVFKSRVLCLRFLNCCFQWAAVVLGYFGLSLSSTHIPGANRYVSFIFVMGAEIPSVLLSQFLLNRMNRRVLISSTVAMAAISIIVSSFIPKENSMIVLILFLLGKAFMTCGFTSLFIYTAEQWPTSIRGTVMNTCLMFARMGSMVAPLAVVLDAKIHSFSALLIGGSALIAAVFVLFSPETFKKKLPDTIDEAKCL